MKTINLDLPDGVDLEPADLKVFLASSLYEKRKLSLGPAAEMAGLSKRAFIEILGNYGVSIFNQDAEEIGADLDNA